MPCVNLPVGVGGRVEMPPIHLERANPVTGIVNDELGRPIAGAVVNASLIAHGPSWLLNDRRVTDAQGRFELSDMGNRLQMQVTDDKHINIDWVVSRKADGLHWGNTGEWNGQERNLSAPVATLPITLNSLAWIEGRATDADTGKPVHLDQIIRCTFDRKPSGEVVLNGCQAPVFRQDADGTFHVPYWQPYEYHLTFTAAGYQDAEAFTPKVAGLLPIPGINVTMHSLKNRSGLRRWARRDDRRHHHTEKASR